MLFCETGLVVTSFAVLAVIDIYILIRVLLITSILGNYVNCEIGRLLEKSS